MANWVDVSGLPYFEDDGGWVGTTYPWQSWWMGRKFNWRHGDDGNGNYTQALVSRVRITIDVTSVVNGSGFDVELPTGEYVTYSSVPGVGEHTITVDLNTPTNFEWVQVRFFYYEGAVTKIEIFTDWSPGVQDQFIIWNPCVHF